jgi:enoyl-CoA hydratase
MFWALVVIVPLPSSSVDIDMENGIMTYKNIIYTKANGIARIVVNRPEVRNVLDMQTKREIKEAICDLEQDNEIRVAIFTGAGDKAFIAGTDVKDVFYGATPEFMRNYAANLGQQLFNDIENLRMPTIAMVNGFCLGGGCELATCCDIRIASENAKFGQPEINVGFSLGGGNTQRLPRLIGFGRAKELIYTGKIIDAFEAERIGLVNKVVPFEKLENTVMELAQTLMSKSPVVMEITKKTVNRSMYTDLAAGLAYELSNFALCFSTEDTKEGIKAFLEKRIPNYTGK